MSTLLFAGLDAGASKTALLAQAEDGRPPLSLSGPAANLQRTGLEGTARVLVDLVRQAQQASPGTTLAGFCAGVAGAGRENDQAALEAEVRRQMGDETPSTLLITHDGLIALEAAFEGESGVIVVVGTGSVVLARDKSRTVHRVGGWGYLFGDEGSGHLIGASGLRRAVHAYDGGPPTLLVDLLARRFDIHDGHGLIRRVYQEHWPVQAVAPLVAEAAAAGDGPCREVIDEQATAIARQVSWIAAGREIERRIALFGGLTKLPYYNQALERAFQEVLPGWHAELARHEPAYGALLMARRGSR